MRYRVAIPATIYVSVEAESENKAIEQGEILRDHISGWDEPLGGETELLDDGEPEGLNARDIDLAVWPGEPIRDGRLRTEVYVTEKDIGRDNSAVEPSGDPAPSGPVQHESGRYIT